MEATKSKNTTDVLDSCLETVREGWEKRLASTLKWTLHATEGDAISELSRAELVFLMAVNALANLDAEMSVILLKEIDKWSIFPRIRKYMSGKMEAEWSVPRKMLDRAAKFAVILERSGMFTVPQDLHSYLAELLTEDTASGSEDTPLFHEQNKRPRKDPHVSHCQQGQESSVGGQASGGEPQQERHYRLVARRRSSRKQGGGGHRKKESHSSSHHMRKTFEWPQRFFDILSTGAVPKGSQKPAESTSQATTSPPTGAIPKVAKLPSASSKTHTKPSTGTIPKVRKVSSYCQTEDCLTSDPVKGTTTASQTLPLGTTTASQTLPLGTTTASQTLPLGTTTASQTLPLISKGETQHQLWEGVEMNDGQKIEGAVLSGANLEEMRDDKMTPLTAAAKEGRVGAVRALMRLGADLERKDGRVQATALHWASAGGHELVARELLAAGATVDSKNCNWQTPLLVASCWGHLSIVRMLVEAGADINARDSSGNTLLTYAERKGRTSVIQYLHSVGANK